LRRPGWTFRAFELHYFLKQSGARTLQVLFDPLLVGQFRTQRLYGGIGTIRGTSPCLGPLELLSKVQDGFLQLCVFGLLGFELFGQIAAGCVVVCASVVGGGGCGGDGG